MVVLSDAWTLYCTNLGNGLFKCIVWMQEVICNSSLIFQQTQVYLRNFLHLKHVLYYWPLILPCWAWQKSHNLHKELLALLERRKASVMNHWGSHLWASPFWPFSQSKTMSHLSIYSSPQIPVPRRILLTGLGTPQADPTKGTEIYRLPSTNQDIKADFSEVARF